MRNNHWIIVIYYIVNLCNRVKILDINLQIMFKIVSLHIRKQNNRHPSMKITFINKTMKWTHRLKRILDILMLGLILLNSITRVHSLINYHKILINGAEIQHLIFQPHHCSISNNFHHHNINNHQIKCSHNHQILSKNIHKRDLNTILILFRTDPKVE